MTAQILLGVFAPFVDSSRNLFPYLMQQNKVRKERRKTTSL
jgi:hypothetical protein